MDGAGAEHTLQEEVSGRGTQVEVILKKEDDAIL